MAIPARPKFEGEAANRAIMIADQAWCSALYCSRSCETGPTKAIRACAPKGICGIYGKPLIQTSDAGNESEYLSKPADGILRTAASCHRLPATSWNQDGIVGRALFWQPSGGCD